MGKLRNLNRHMLETYDIHTLGNVKLKNLNPHCLKVCRYLSDNRQ